MLADKNEKMKNLSKKYKITVYSINSNLFIRFFESPLKLNVGHFSTSTDSLSIVHNSTRSKSSSTK